MGSEEGGSPVGTARHPVRAGTGQAGPLLSPLPLRLQEAGDGEGWQAARWHAAQQWQLGLCESVCKGEGGLAMGWDVGTLGVFLPASHAVCWPFSVAV